MLAEVKVGDPADFRNFMGAVIDRKAFDKITAYIEAAKRAPGVKLLFGGGADDKDGYFIAPTLLQVDDPRYRTMCEEIFGPVLSVHVFPAARWAEVLRVVDQTSPYALTRPALPPYPPTAPHPVAVGDSLLGPSIYTLDAHDTERWRRFDFGRNAAVDSGSWDIAFRRFHVITAPGGGVVDLGPVPFDAVRELPDTGYRANASGPDTTNPGVGKWYADSMLSHRLTSQHHVYGVRTAAGRSAKLSRRA